ncbi:MAG: DNA recombination protein RmuC [Candidatus Paceibacterota bacterium]
MNNFVLVLILVLVVFANGIFFWMVLNRVKNKEDEDMEPEDDRGMTLLLQQMNELSRVVDSKMGESTKVMQESMRHQADQSLGVIRDITERLTRLDETNKQVVSFTDQLQSLQDILKNPKQRGILGEYYLETLLKNVLPPGSFQMQYAFADGEIVDAAVFVRDKIIPVDSKFSLENYNRIIEERNEVEKARLEKVFVNDLKMRIQETSKYIRPNEGTMDFAFMFIPHEAIYYDLLVNKIGAMKGEDTENLIQRAAGKYKVIIVSPTSFLAYLQTVLQGLKALQIEESAKEIRARVEDLGKHISAHDQYMVSLGNALGTTVNHFNKAHKELQKMDKDVLRITGESGGIEALVIEKPEREE